MKTLGIDLSLTGTGLAVVDHGELVRVSTVKSKGTADASLLERGMRLDQLADRITEHVLTEGTDLVVIEAPAFASKSGHMHDRSGLWWITVNRLLTWNLLVAEVTPTGRATYGTGKGNAGKDAVLAAVIRRYDTEAVPINNNNEADAVVLASMGARQLGEPVEPSLPQTHLRAMDAVRWPEFVPN